MEIIIAVGIVLLGISASVLFFYSLIHYDKKRSLRLKKFAKSIGLNYIGAKYIKDYDFSNIEDRVDTRFKLTGSLVDLIEGKYQGHSIVVLTRVEGGRYRYPYTKIFIDGKNIFLENNSINRSWPGYLKPKNIKEILDHNINK